MSARRVFVSGGAGVIGRELCSRLLSSGASVLVGDLKPCPPEWVGRLEYRQGDLNTLTQDEVAAFSPDLFIHLAATFERSAESWGFWDENFQHNVALSHHLMTLMRAAPSLERVVFASSYLIYDPDLYQFEQPRSVPVRLSELDPIRPRNLVGMAKLAHEMELRFLEGFSRTRFDSTCVRIFRGYGLGARDVIARWTQALVRGEPITVYQPEGRFDYIFARDTANGLLRLAEVDALPSVVNLGTGRARTVAEVVRVLGDHFPDMVCVHEGASTLPYEASEADLSRFTALTRWSPEYDLERAIPEIIAYERGQLENGSR
jgi:carbamoyl-phosphate synthase large subunit